MFLVRRMLRRVSAGGTIVAATVAMVMVAAALSPSAASAGARTELVLHSFGGLDGAGPLSGVIVGPDGVLYGTTRSGGRQTNCSDGGPGGVLGCGSIVYALSA